MSENIDEWMLLRWVLLLLWDKGLKCLNQSKPGIKVASKFHQTCRLSTVGIVSLEHVFIHNTRYIIGLYHFIDVSYTFAEAELL